MEGGRGLCGPEKVCQSCCHNEMWREAEDYVVRRKCVSRVVTMRCGGRQRTMWSGESVSVVLSQ